MRGDIAAVAAISFQLVKVSRVFLAIAQLASRPVEADFAVAVPFEASITSTTTGAPVSVPLTNRQFQSIPRMAPVAIFKVKRLQRGIRPTLNTPDSAARRACGRWQMGMLPVVAIRATAKDRSQVLRVNAGAGCTGSIIAAAYRVHPAEPLMFSVARMECWLISQRRQYSPLGSSSKPLLHAHAPSLVRTSPYGQMAVCCGLLLSAVEKVRSTPDGCHRSDQPQPSMPVHWDRIPTPTQSCGLLPKFCSSSENPTRRSPLYSRSSSDEASKKSTRPVTPSKRTRLSSVSRSSLPTT
eukprot:6763222-Prymnesium_polylepis.1